MANLVIKNNTGTASSLTFDNKSGSDWKIINNNGTFTLNGKSTNWFTLSDAGIAKFEGRVAIQMEPDKSGDHGETYAASALSVNGFILAYNGNIRAVKDSDDTVMVWIKNNKGSVSLLADNEGKYGLLDRLHGDNGTWMLYYDTANARQQQNTTYFTGTPSVANSTYQPALHFTSSNVAESFMGRISYGLSSDKDKTTYDVNRFYFQQYSFKEGTKTKMDKEGSGDSAYNPYERFRLPATEPGITGKHTYDILTTKHTVSIKQGGTNAATAAGARQNINYIGSNPITTTTNDTHENWAALGTGVAYYNKAGQLNGQPTQYGMIFNQTTGGQMVSQLWVSPTTGRAFLRGADSGDFGEWYKILTSKDTVTVVQGGTGKTSWTANTLVWASGTTTLTSGHYASSTKIGVNMNSAPDVTFGVAGGIRSYNSSVSAVYDTATATQVYATNTKGSIGLIVNADGRMGLYDRTGDGLYLIYRNADDAPTDNNSGNLRIGSSYLYTKGVRPQTQNEWSCGAADYAWYAVNSRRFHLYDGTNTAKAYGRFVVSGEGKAATSSAEAVQGHATLYVGNDNAANTDGGAYGRIYLYSKDAYAGIIQPPNSITANITFYMPNTGGTLVTHATRGTAVGDSTTPVYIARTGRATACSAYAGGSKVTLNGTDKGAAAASFYAPTGAGTSGYILKSNGSGAPTWAAVSNGDPTLAWGTTSTVGTVAGTALKVTMPANPNTDKKVEQSRSTTKDYRPILMHSDHKAYGTDPGAATAETYYHESVAISPSSGMLRATQMAATKFAVNTKDSGYYLRDSTDTAYPGVYDNGSNLWIGSIHSSARHHRGATYISAGHDGSAGNTSIYIAVPNAANDGSTNYLVFHRGYLNVGDATHGTLAIGRGGTGMTSNPSLLVNLGSTSAASVFAASPRPGITGTLGVAHGGTGHSSWTANRIVWSNGTTSLTAGSHYADNDHIHINGTSKPDTALKVTGTAFVTAIVNCGALFIGKNNDAAGHRDTGWGTSKPANNVPEGLGRVYFQVIS